MEIILAETALLIFNSVQLAVILWIRREQKKVKDALQRANGDLRIR